MDTSGLRRGASGTSCFRSTVFGTYVADGLIYDLRLSFDWSNFVESKKGGVSG
jgi:hypothetical protein